MCFLSFFAANAKHDLFEKLFNKLFINLTTTQPQAISALESVYSFTCWADWKQLI